MDRDMDGDISRDMDWDMDRDGERDEDRDTDGDGYTERDRDMFEGYENPGTTFEFEYLSKFETNSKII